MLYFRTTLGTWARVAMIRGVKIGKPSKTLYFFSMINTEAETVYSEVYICFVCDGITKLSQPDRSYSVLTLQTFAF